jgi:hypothetical protein
VRLEPSAQAPEQVEEACDAAADGIQGVLPGINVGKKVAAEEDDGDQPEEGLQAAAARPFRRTRLSRTSQALERAVARTLLLTFWGRSPKAG